MRCGVGPLTEIFPRPTVKAALSSYFAGTRERILVERCPTVGNRQSNFGIDGITAALARAAAVLHLALAMMVSEEVTNLRCSAQ